MRDGVRGQRPAGRPGRGRSRHRRRSPFQPRRPPGRRDYRAQQRQARQRVQDRAASVHAAVRLFSRPPGGTPGDTGVRVLQLVCLCLGLLWLRPRPLAAAVTPGLAVLFTLAVATR
jgi:hypothetical protein